MYANVADTGVFALLDLSVDELSKLFASTDDKADDVDEFIESQKKLSTKQVTERDIHNLQRWLYDNKRVRMRQELLEGRTTGADGAVTESGWSNSDIFRQYIETHLIKYLPERNHEQPDFLLYDVHKSHVSMELIEWAKTNHIILFVLPAHTSRVLQPMDVRCFGPFERIFNNKCHKYMRAHCGESVTRNNICAIACKANSEALSPENLHGAFRKAGIYPYNPNAFERSNFEPASVLEKEEEKSAEKETTVEQSTSFFHMKESVIIKKKAPSKKRRYLSTIVSGKAITEDDMIERIEEHQSKSNGKSKSPCNSTKTSKKKKK